MLAQRRFPWLRAARPPAADVGSEQSRGAAVDREDVWLALEALHSVYEDFKLHTGRWPLLAPLGRLLHEMATLLNAADYVDMYSRDLGPAVASAQPQHRASQRKGAPPGQLKA